MSSSSSSSTATPPRRREPPRAADDASARDRAWSRVETPRRAEGGPASRARRRASADDPGPANEDGAATTTRHPMTRRTSARTSAPARRLRRARALGFGGAPRARVMATTPRARGGMARPEEGTRRNPPAGTAPRETRTLFEIARELSLVSPSGGGRKGRDDEERCLLSAAPTDALARGALQRFREKNTREKAVRSSHRSSTNQRSPWPSNRTAGRRVSSRGAFNSSILESRREDLPPPRPPRSPPGRRGGRGCVVEISGYRVGRGGGRPFTHAPERGATLKQLRNHGLRLHVHRGRAPRRPGARSARPRPRSAPPPRTFAIRHRSGGIGTLSAPSEITPPPPPRARP